MTELSAVQAAFTAGYAAAGVAIAGYGNPVGPPPASYDPITGGPTALSAGGVSAAAQAATATGYAAASP